MENVAQQSEKLDFDKVWLMFKETDLKFKETDKKFQSTDKKLNQLEQLFTSQWGKLMETLVEGDLIKLLNDRGVAVYVTKSRVKGIHNNRQFEFDIIAENGDDIVVVEVKTTLKPVDIKEFLKELKSFKTLMPRYKDNRVLGAVAFLTEAGDAVQMAQKKGLFVIRATGSSASIINNDDFKPFIW